MYVSSAVLNISVFSIVGYKPMLNEFTKSIIASMSTYLYAPMPTIHTYLQCPIVQGVGRIAIAINVMHVLY